MAYVLIGLLLVLALATFFGTDSRPGVDDPPQRPLWWRDRS